MKKILILIVTMLVVLPVIAQDLEVSLQLRPRFEFRNGYKTLLNEGQDPVGFVSQRSRLNLKFSHEKLQLKFSPQNIRVWGDVPLMALADKNGITVFEAFGTYMLHPNLNLSVGRQVLSYDNQRILGEVDWAQQGQSHDAALLSWDPVDSQRLDFGIALNSEKENYFYTPYQVNNYKNLQFLWYHLNFSKSEISFLFLNTGYEFPVIASREIQYIQTTGAYFKFVSNNSFGDLYGYVQLGKKSNKEIHAWNLGGTINHKITDIWSIAAGAEYLSGTDMNTTSRKLKSFTPPFGTNHAFNGFMDYFYVGNHQNSVGLTDLFGKLTYTSGKLSISAFPHLFYSAATIQDLSLHQMNPYLGSEIDVTGQYVLDKLFSVAVGYSQLFGTNGLEILKGGNVNQTQNWAWVAVNFNSRLFPPMVKN